MRKTIVALAIAGVLAGGWAMPIAAQDGIVIQNNGVSSTDSAAGADNVNVSLAAGNSSSTNGPGVNNEAGQLVREEKDRNRKDRGDRNNTEELAAPVEEAAVPVEGDLQAYAEGEEWVEPAPAMEAAPQEAVAELASGAVLQLPNTGAGDEPSLPLYLILAGAAAAAVGGVRLSRRSA
jgi:hypothetical protein